MAASSPQSHAWTEDEVRAAFTRWQAAEPERAALLGTEAPAYFSYHASRYARLMSAIDSLVRAARPSDRLRVLDIGPNAQTALLRATYSGAIVDTLGFVYAAYGPREHERHVLFDLNEAHLADRRPQLERQYDLVVLAEVVEHLHRPLATILECVKTWLRPPGFVVVQTPNGAALHKRLRLLMGRSPIEPPRVSSDNPGHFHEYTLAELRQQVAAAGLTIERLDVDNYFGGPSAAARAYRAIGPVLPPTLRHGVTLCARASPEERS